MPSDYYTEKQDNLDLKKADYHVDKGNELYKIDSHDSLDYKKDYSLYMNKTSSNPSDPSDSLVDHDSFSFNKTSVNLNSNDDNDGVNMELSVSKSNSVLLNDNDDDEHGKSNPISPSSPSSFTYSPSIFVKHSSSSSLDDDADDDADAPDADPDAFSSIQHVVVVNDDDDSSGVIINDDDFSTLDQTSNVIVNDSPSLHSNFDFSDNIIPPNVSPPPPPPIMINDDDDNNDAFSSIQHVVVVNDSDDIDISKDNNPRSLPLHILPPSPSSSSRFPSVRSPDEVLIEIQPSSPKKLFIDNVRYDHGSVTTVKNKVFQDDATLNDSSCCSSSSSPSSPLLHDDPDVSFCGHVAAAGGSLSSSSSSIIPGAAGSSSSSTINNGGIVVDAHLVGPADDVAYDSSEIVSDGSTVVCIREDFTSPVQDPSVSTTYAGVPKDEHDDDSSLPSDSILKYVLLSLCFIPLSLLIFVPCLVTLILLAVFWNQL